MNLVVDSSAWIEVLSSGALASRCEVTIRRAAKVCVPSVVLFEVYRKVKRTLSEEDALEVVATVGSNRVLELTAEVALLAGDLSIDHRLSTVDALVLAHARYERASLLTLDNDFAELDDVIIPRR